MASADLLAHWSLQPLKNRNQLLDDLFYDVGSLTPAERKDLSPSVDREGTLIVVSPGAARRGIRHYRNSWRMLEAEGDEVAGVAIAGVGSSVLGTAALARNVADAVGGDIVGLVSGYGVSDLLSEALGGWFFFGAIDRISHELDLMLEQLNRAATLFEPMAATRAGPAGGLERADALPPQTDTVALLDLLVAAPPNLKWLVGHSKGCLLIDFVLEKLLLEQPSRAERLADQLRIVTLGAVVALPGQFQDAQQLIGEIDWFGGLNSRADLPRVTVPGAWHHLNRRLPAHLDAEAAVRAVARSEAAVAGSLSVAS